jgi:glutamate synthase domain-containing protein 1
MDTSKLIMELSRLYEDLNEESITYVKLIGVDNWIVQKTNRIRISNFPFQIREGILLKRTILKNKQVLRDLKELASNRYHIVFIPESSGSGGKFIVYTYTNKILKKYRFYYVSISNNSILYKIMRKLWKY